MPLTVPTPDEIRSPVRVHRDPFARFSTVRIKAHGECEWCGRPARFRYGVLEDARPTPHYDLHVYCSIDCRRCYLGT